MNKGFVTVLTGDNPNEIVVAKSLLEDAGIETKVADELISQVNPLYTTAVGGVKLQVSPENHQLAIQLLQEGGFISGAGITNKTLAEKLADLWYDKKPVFVSGLAAMVVITGLIIWTVNKRLLPSTKEMLLNGNWCVDQIIYDSSVYYPETIKMIRMSGPGYCEEEVRFERSGTIILPGFQSREIRAGWEANNDEVEIYSADSFDFVFNGSYQMLFEGHTLLLSSATTVIQCTSLKKADWWFK